MKSKKNIISKSIELVPPTILNAKKSENNLAINEDNLFLNNGNKNYYERANRFYNNKFNTLKMIVDKNKPFNYRGQIDIIVEE